MSKYAVLILPFLIVSVVAVEPLISKSSTETATKIENLSSASGDNQKFNQIEIAELLAQNSLISNQLSEENLDVENPKMLEVLITAYSSTPEQTDDTPFITASGNYVRSGVVAANFLPLGTKIRIPEVFGDKIFVVEDRTHEKYSDRVDVWLPTKEEATRFGVKISEIEIL
jgi:3D (Asp-Asp-Asp) domain-containing protein